MNSKILQTLERLNASHITIEGDADIREAVAEALNIARSEQRDCAKRDEGYERLQALGKTTAECLAEMVAALECDYDRLEELRDERKTLADEIGTHGQTKAKKKAAKAALEEWDEGNGDELKELTDAAGDCTDRDDAEQRIREDPLSVELSFGSCTVGETPEADGFIILLGTGGPATRIVGELDANNEPGRAWIETQDWFLPWTEYHGEGIERDALLTYCRYFFFGE